LGYLHNGTYHFNDDIAYQSAIKEFGKSSYLHRLDDSMRFEDITHFAFKTISNPQKKESLKNEFLCCLIESEFYPFNVDLNPITSKNKDQVSLRISDPIEKILFKLPSKDEISNQLLCVLENGSMILPSRKIFFKILLFNFKDPLMTDEELKWVKSNDYSIVYLSWVKSTQFAKGDMNEIQDFFKNEKIEIYFSCLEDFLRDYPETLEYQKKVLELQEEIENYQDEIDWKDKEEMDELIETIKSKKNPKAALSATTLSRRQRK
jgi:hypothetical protein